MRRTAPEPAAPIPTSASRQWKDNLDFRFDVHQVQIHGGSCAHSCFEYGNLRSRNRALIIMPPPALFVEWDASLCAVLAI
ncbi:hypothetical protein AVEN_184315-1 [Araneus ventricosus]|uniref:Uncharacterized protein n=1 Tax=Araneus ventricosus TaxID=182803 RepID=A0A4Y2K3V7_ARAVE|nr:hypothetical protein AVEN_184315-1 [Araneus ventricosus]